MGNQLFQPNLVREDYEVNKLCINELKQSGGMLKDTHILPYNMVSPINIIMFSYANGLLQITKLPANIRTLYLLVDESNIDVYTSEELVNQAHRFFYPKRKIIKLDNTRTNSVYATNSIPDLLSAKMATNISVFCFVNSLRIEHHYERVNGSQIRIYILRNNYIYIMPLNLVYDDITFRPSTYFEGQLDIIINDKPQPNDIVIPETDGGKILQHDMLAQKLKKQSYLSPSIDPDMYYYEQIYVLDEDRFGEKTFVSTSNYSNQSDYQKKLDFFSGKA